METLKNFINGRSSGRVVEKLNQQLPKTKGESPSFVNSDYMDIVAAVQAGNNAQRKWQELTTASRILLLENFGQLIEENLEVFIRFESEDQGSSPQVAKKLCLYAIQNFYKCLKFQPESQYLSQKNMSQFQVHSALGLTGLILDWQQSFAVLLANLAMSLRCGNLVILQPSELSMRSSLKLAELAIQAKILDGVFNVILGRGDAISIAMLEHPGVKYLAYYGESSRGEMLHKLAAENHKRLHSFLGVHNAAIAFADCDLKGCISKILELGLELHYYGRNRINRILVQEKILKEFKQELINQIEARIEDGSLAEMIGCLPINEFNVRFINYIKKSEKDRAKILIRKDFKDSTQMPLVIYEDLTNCSTLYQEDLLGPILFLQSFKYAADLPKILNSGAFGGTTYIWTNDIIRSHKLGGQIDSSRIIFNFKTLELEEFASQNIKQSGTGMNGIAALFDFNINRKSISIQST